MIEAKEIRDRQEGAREAARRRGAAALLAIGGPFYDRPGDLAYLSGHYPPFPSSAYDGDYRGLGFGAVVLPIDGGAHLVTDTAAYREERLAVDEVRPTRNVPAELGRLLGELGLGSSKLAFAGGQVAPFEFVREFSDGLGLDLDPADDVVRSARRRKSPAEVAALRRAAEVAELGMAAALAAIEPDQTESEVCAAGVAACLAAGADFVRYLRVLSGPFAGWPHRWPPATERRLADGETVCMDLIGAVDGYQFDILRAAVVGEGDPEMRRLMGVARDATEAAIATCGPGVPVREVVAAADGVLERAGQLQNRARFTGHGIGLETVEAPLIMEDSDDVLEPGDVICLEPGILVKGSHGARFEYEVAITESGSEVLARESRSIA